MSKEQAPKYTSVGGQALIEGVMMQGKERSAMAVRKPDGTIHLETWENKKRKSPIFRTPVFRGLISYFLQMKSGYGTLMKSAEISGFAEEEEPGKFEQFLEKVLGEKAAGAIFWVAGILALVLSLFLFMYLPAFLVSQLSTVVNLGIFRSAIESLIKVAVLVTYLALTARLSEMKRMYQYHGAEHKTIFCYEAGEELTVENVRKQGRLHPMCGTSFLLIILLVGIFVFSFITWGSPLVRTFLKVLLLPVTVGISYELIRYTKLSNNWFTRIVSAPGLWLQKITTNEPTDDQIEVAIASLKAVLPRDDKEKAKAHSSEKVEAVVNKKTTLQKEPQILENETVLSSETGENSKEPFAITKELLQSEVEKKESNTVYKTELSE